MPVVKKTVLVDRIIGITPVYVARYDHDTGRQSYWWSTGSGALAGGHTAAEVEALIAGTVRKQLAYHLTLLAVLARSNRRDLADHARDARALAFAVPTVVEKRYGYGRPEYRDALVVQRRWDGNGRQWVYPAALDHRRAYVAAHYLRGELVLNPAGAEQTAPLALAVPARAADDDRLLAEYARLYPAVLAPLGLPELADATPATVAG